MTQGERIAAAAKTWLGTPYANNSIAKGYGVDCAHLLLGTLIDAGLLQEEDMIIEYYPNEWHLHRSEERFIENIEKVAYEVDNPQIGDFLLYQYGRTISHGAILVDKDTVIHAFVDLGVIMSKTDDILFYDNRGRHRLRRIYRFKGGE